MEKKLALLFASAFLMVCSVANAQIGVNRKGKLLNYNWWTWAFGAYHINDYKSEESHGDIFKIPIFLNGTKSVNIIITEIKYDMFYDVWVRSDSSTSIVYFDSLGRINHSIVRSTRIDDNKYEYENGRIKNIYNDNVLLFSFRYDQNGSLKMILCGNHQWSVSYSPQGVISQLREFKEGEEYNSSPIKFKYTTDGYSITTKPMRFQWEYYFQTDKHGNITKRTEILKEKEKNNRGDYTGKILKKTETDYYENTYDKNGNLIKQLHYQMKDFGKYYIDGFELFYEYLYE